MTNRTDRVGESIKEEFADMLERGEIKDPRIGFITITDVDVSRDMRHARIFFSSLGKAREKARAAEGLNSARGFIRTELGKKLRLKYIPELTFVIDDTVEASIRIAELINELHRKETGSDK